MINMERISIQRHLTVEAISPRLLKDSLAHALWPSRSAHGLRLLRNHSLSLTVRNAAMTFKLIRILPDGSCLFRSVACGLVNLFCGHCEESGSPFNSESTIVELMHNLLAQYLRIYAVIYVSGSNSVRFDSRIGGKYSGYDVLRYLHRFLRQESNGRVFSAERLAKMRASLTPKLKTLALREDAPLNGDGLKRKNLIEDETLEQYCRRMIRPETWGGELEILALANVLQIPIHLYFYTMPATGKNRRRQVKRYDVASAKVCYKLRLHYNGTNHYDALCDTQRGILNRRR